MDTLHLACKCIVWFCILIFNTKPTPQYRGLIFFKKKSNNFLSPKNRVRFQTVGNQ